MQFSSLEEVTNFYREKIRVLESDLLSQVEREAKAKAQLSGVLTELQKERDILFTFSTEMKALQEVNESLRSALQRESEAHGAFIRSYMHRQRQLILSFKTLHRRQSLKSKRG